ncbi:MAG: hypothetical protein ABI205_01525, partial [Gemmatimonadaceae bacterium]
MFTPTSTTGYSGTAGSAITNPPVVVTAEDQYDNAAPSFISSVAINITPSTNTTSAVLTGNSVTAAAGVATFSAIAVNKAGIGYTFTASGSGVTSAVSAPVTISAAAASQLIVTTGTSTTSSLLVGSTVTGFAYPSVTLLDAGGNAVPNAGTVTYSLTSGAGPCTILNGGAVPVNANGVAALSATYLGVATTTASSCTLHAVSSAVTGTTYDFNVIVAPSSGISWLGKSSTTFTDTANWRGSVIPDSTDAIFIPRFTHYSPTMAGTRAVAGVTIEALGTLNLGGATDTLKVGGNVATDSTGTITNGVVMTTAAGTVEGVVPGLVIAATTTLAATTSASTVQITAGSLDVAGKTLTISGALGTSGSGILKMLPAATTNDVTVGGNASFDGGSESGSLTEGAFTVNGNFTQSHVTGSTSSFAPSGVDFSVYFSATSGGAQTVSFADPEYSFFANVVAYHSITFATRTLINSAFTTNGSGTVATFSSTDSLHNVVV